MIRLYGVPTCKKIINTKKLLDEKNLNYEFINVKKHPIPEIQLRNIVNSLGLEQVLNSKGPTFRKLGLNSTKLSNDELFKVLFQEQGFVVLYQTYSLQYNQTVFHITLLRPYLLVKA